MKENFTSAQEHPESNEIRDDVLTQKVTQVLEQSAKNSAPTRFLAQAVRAPIDGLKRMYTHAQGKQRQLIGALLFSAILDGTSVAVAQDSSESPDTEVLQGYKEQRADFLNHLEDLSAAERKVIYSVIADPDDPTILFFGQIHDTDPESNYQGLSRIVESQGSISYILSKINKVSPDVFLEGYTELSVNDTERLEAIALSMQKAPNLETVLNIYNTSHREATSFRDAWKMLAILNNLLSKELITFGYKETRPFVYTHDNGHTITLQESGISIKARGTASDTAEALIAGGARILDANGKINIHPAERPESNKASFDTENEIRRSGESIQMFAQEHMAHATNLDIEDGAKDIEEFTQSEWCKNNIECLSHAAQIKAAKDRLDYEIFDLREKVAIELIATHDQNNNSSEFYPLIYGNAHDFEDEVREWNRNHPEQQFNLITIKPDETREE